MRRKRMRKKRRPVPVPIAAMGDIAFLLIIFFMVASEFVQEENLDLELPLSAQVRETEHAPVARVAVDAEGEIFMDGEPMSAPQDVEFAVRALITETLTDDQRRVEFKCDSKLTKTQFEPVLKAIAEAGGIIEAIAEPIE